MVVCLGLHLAYMELRCGAARFFRTFPEAKVSDVDGRTEDAMRPKIYLIVSPKGKKCLIEAR